MNIILNSNLRDGLLNPKESERAVPNPKVGCWISAVKPSGGKPEAARLHAGLQRALRISEYLFQHFKHWNFYNDFYPAVFKPILVIFFKTSVLVILQYARIIRMKYLQALIFRN